MDAVSASGLETRSSNDSDSDSNNNNSKKKGSSRAEERRARGWVAAGATTIGRETGSAGSASLAIMMKAMPLAICKMYLLICRI
jgi:hypothetical protein